MIGISLAQFLCKWCRLGLHERWRFAIYARLARNVGSKYIEYRIQAEECSLIENYNKDDMVIRDPVALKVTVVYIFEETHLFEHSGLCSTSKSG